MAHFSTPLRYPGGKQKIAPFIYELLTANGIDGHYVEPYAGGAGVAIDLLLSKKIKYIHLNDSDYGIYAFWYSILHKTEEFCKLISSASLSVEEWKKHREIVRKCDRRLKLQLGFSVFYLNRCNRSGILNAGVIGGLDQKGNYKMNARFSRNDLIRRIESIAIHKEQIALTNDDAEYFIKNKIQDLPKNSLIYFDPPYYLKGGELYLNYYNKEDHEKIAQLIQKTLHHYWILSYDNVSPIVNLYKKRRHFFYDLQYSAGSVYKGKEIFIFSDKINIPSKSSLANIDQGLKYLL